MATKTPVEQMPGAFFTTVWPLANLALCLIVQLWASLTRDEKPSYPKRLAWVPPIIWSSYVLEVVIEFAMAHPMSIQAELSSPLWKIDIWQVVLWQIIIVFVQRDEVHHWPAFIAVWVLSGLLDIYVYFLYLSNYLSEVFLPTHAIRVWVITGACVLFFRSGGFKKMRKSKPTKEVKPLLKQKQPQDSFIKQLSILQPVILPLQDQLVQAQLTLLAASYVINSVAMIAIPLQFSKFIANPNVTTLVWWSLPRIIKIGSDSMQFYMHQKIKNFCDKNITVTIFAKLMSLSQDYHSKTSSGGALAELSKYYKLTSMVEFAFSIVEVIFHFSTTIITAPLLFGSTVTYLVATTATMYFNIMMQGDIRDIVEDNIKFNKAKNETAYEFIRNWWAVTILGITDMGVRRYERDVENYKGSLTRTAQIHAIQMILKELCLTIGIGLGLLYVIKTEDKSEMTRTIPIFVSYWYLITEPFNQSGGLFAQFNTLQVPTENLCKLLGLLPSVRDREGALPLKWKGGRIVFDRVSFAYDPVEEDDDESDEPAKSVCSDEGHYGSSGDPGGTTKSSKQDRGTPPVLQDVSFVIEPGQRVAFVGKSGEGKSTILQLLTRFYDVGETAGKITIDGQDIRDVTLESLRSLFAYVPQDHSVFNMTIKENLLLAKMDSVMEELEEVCKKACLHDFLSLHPEGYDIKVGEGGVRLSGGQKQRLQIAMALLREAPIVLFDEATSALDSQTEAQLQTSVDSSCHDQTVISIAHRLGTIKKADVIFVLDEGKIVERGTHDNLLELGGQYAAMWKPQSDSKP